MAKRPTRQERIEGRQMVLRRLLGDDLAVLRHRAGLSQKALARELACSRCFISQLEHGASLPGAPMLARLLDVLNPREIARAA